GPSIPYSLFPIPFAILSVRRAVDADGHQVVQLAAHLLDAVAGAGLVGAVGEQDRPGAAVGVDPEGGAGEAGVTEGTEGDAEAGGCTAELVGVVPAEGAGVGAELSLGEARDRFGLEDADAVELTAVHEHCGEAREIVDGGEEAGVAGDAAELTGERIVD